MVSDSEKLFVFFVFLCVFIDLSIALDHDRVKSSEGAEVSPPSLHPNLAHVRVHRVPGLDDPQPSSDAMVAGSLLLLSMI